MKTPTTKLIFHLLSLIFIIPLSAFATDQLEKLPIKKFNPNPINVAVLLTEQLDSASMASTCEYYGYINQPSQDRYVTFKHPNGSIIRYNFTIADNGKLYPTVEVKSKGTQKDKDQRLQELNFKKNGNTYERRSIGYITRCASAPQDFLRLSNHPKEKP